MIGWIVFLWFALNYAFAAQLVYMASRRSGASPRKAFSVAAQWPRALLHPTPSPI